MNNWINKTFFKSTCVKAIVYCEDKRVRTYYVVPDKNQSTITINSLGKTFTIIDEDKNKKNNKYHYIDSKGFPVYLFNYDRLEAIDPLDAKNLGTRTPAEVSKALNAKIIQELFSAVNSSLQGNMVLLILVGVMVLGFGLIYYMFTNEIQSLKDLIANTTTALGGVL